MGSQSCGGWAEGTLSPSSHTESTVFHGALQNQPSHPPPCSMSSWWRDRKRVYTFIMEFHGTKSQGMKPDRYKNARCEQDNLSLGLQGQWTKLCHEN